MARLGIDYFYTDVHIFEDDKLFDVQNDYGPLGEVIYLRLLCLIYKNGYYYKFELLEKLAAMLIKSIGNKWARDKQVVVQVILFLSKCNLFSSELMEENVLTSASIQKRYLKATERRQPLNEMQYGLVDKNGNDLLSAHTNKISVYNNDLNVDGNAENVDGGTQSKVKESKVNINNTTAAAASAKQDVDSETVKVATKRTSKKPKEYAKDSIEFRSSKYLADKILEKNPNAKVPKTDAEIFKWCEHIDLLMRVDKKPVGELGKVLEFAVSDAFWSTNILSTKSFRARYDQLYLKMQQGKGGANGSNNGYSDKHKNNTVPGSTGSDRFAGIKYKDGGTGEFID